MSYDFACKLLWSLVGVPRRSGEVWSVNDKCHKPSSLFPSRIGVVVGERRWVEDETDAGGVAMVRAILFPRWYVCHPVAFEDGAVELIPEFWLKKFSTRIA